VQVVRQSNGLGIAGFVVSLIAFLTCGLLSPVGMLLSFMALFKRPRGFAVAGFVLGTLGTLFMAGALLAMVTAFGGVEGARKMIGNVVALLQADQKIKEYEKQNHALPDDETGQALVQGFADGNGMPVRYHLVKPDKYELRSAGPDQEFDTPDDLTNDSFAPD
jgi:hypothetical protein